jgi:hypothetical protein
MSFTVNLENQPHNNVHNMLSYPMSDRSYSPRDPVFWLHHSLLDFAWEQWRGVPGHEDLVTSPSLASWRRRPLPGFTGSQFPRRLVEDFLSISELGYTYVDQTIEFIAKTTEQPTISVSGDLDFEVAKLPPAPPVSVREVLIRFAEVQSPKTAVMQIRVFLGVPDANETTPLDHPGLVGMFTLYPARPGHDHSQDPVTIELNATEVVGRMISEKSKTTFPISIVTLSFDDKGESKPNGEPLKYKSASVQIGR